MFFLQFSHIIKLHPARMICDRRESMASYIQHNWWYKRDLHGHHVFLTSWISFALIVMILAYFVPSHEIRRCLSISWAILGFPEYNFEDSTLWIGSEGAHTPCHKDTYGCNLVAQIYGRKRWILFPPDEDLCSTRVPYEESSIYSKLNFFSPSNINVFQDLKQCKSIVLEPGQVLFVPNGWWHYVENLEIAMSINVWIQLKTDAKQQLKESLVQMFVSQIIKDLNTNVQKELLNPNMEELHLDSQNVYKSIDVINLCKKNYTGASTNSNDSSDLEELFNKYSKYLHKIPNLSNINFNNLMKSQAQRFTYDEECTRDEGKLDVNIRNIINAFTNEDVINLIAEKIINNKI